VSAVKATLQTVPLLGDDRQALLLRLTDGLEPAQLYWIAAYAAGLASQQPGRHETLQPVTAGPRLTVLYGSQTGNAKRLAEQLANRAEAAGLAVRVVRAGAYATRELAQERYLAVVISTQGEGEPPDDARGFVEFLAGRRAPKLPSLKFSVLGLGDSSYPKFCEMGRQLDARFAELGASRLAPLGEADVDIETVATPWSEHALKLLREQVEPAAPSASVTPLRASAARPQYSREQPFAATLLDNQRIVARDSARDVRHIELSLEGSGLHYEPGDALGVWPRNPPALVAQVLELLGLDGDAEVEHQGRRLSLARWLESERELTRLSRPLIQAQAERSGNAELRQLLQPGQQAALAALLESHQPLDLLRRYPARWDAPALVGALRPLTPRLYSIASSSHFVGPDEVHLTVAPIDYEAHGSRHVGAASAFLAAAGEDASVRVFIEENERFRLPADTARDVIMIGPGTGVAPFRGFVQEREIAGGSGRNWLFFGNRHGRQDFLYQLEWQDALRRGALSRLDVAFSRDQADKRYVQHALQERGAEIHDWLSRGAHLYVCGDANHMARDVHAALIDIVATHGGHSTEQAQTWLSELMQQGRYARDVY
jgi:sulfite reductase (NADPH) flavoprotein alpha-component